jgi:hypothetical protein
MLLLGGTLACYLDRGTGFEPLIAFPNCVISSSLCYILLMIDESKCLWWASCLRERSLWLWTSCTLSPLICPADISDNLDLNRLLMGYTCVGIENKKHYA